MSGGGATPKANSMGRRSCVGRVGRYVVAHGFLQSAVGWWVSSNFSDFSTLPVWRTSHLANCGHAPHPNLVSRRRFIYFHLHLPPTLCFQAWVPHPQATLSPMSLCSAAVISVVYGQAGACAARSRRSVPALGQPPAACIVSGR